MKALMAAMSRRWSTWFAMNAANSRADEGRNGSDCGDRSYPKAGTGEVVCDP